jgi:amino acid permease
MIWAVIFCCCFVFPISLPRELSALRFTSAFSVLISFYVVLVIFFECILNHGTSPSVSEGFKAAHNKTHIQPLTIFNCLPLIIFAFMYQINIPALYNELEDKTLKSMTTILTSGTTGAGILYIIAGMFGISAFAACGPQGYPMNYKLDPPKPFTYDSIMKE